MLRGKVKESADRLAEFARQARMNRDINPLEAYTVWTDPKADRAHLSLADIELVLRELRQLDDKYWDVLGDLQQAEMEQPEW